MATKDPNEGDGEFDFAPAPKQAPATPAPSPDDGWGVDPPPDAEPPRDDWLIGAREITTASTATPDTTWGIEPSPAERDASRARAESPLGEAGRRTGFTIGTSTARRPEPKRPARNSIRRFALLVAAAAALLIGARLALNALEPDEEPRTPTLVPLLPHAASSDAAPALAAPTDATDATPTDATDATDASDAARLDAALPTVTVEIAPVAANVVRVRDKTLICAAAYECPLVIDLDYDIIASGHRTRRVSGDDLYDRRRSGRMRIVLEPLDRPVRKGR